MRALWFPPKDGLYWCTGCKAYLEEHNFQKLVRHRGELRVKSRCKDHQARKPRSRNPQREFGVCKVGHGKFPEGVHRCIECRREYDRERRRPSAEVLLPISKVESNHYICIGFDDDRCEEKVLAKNSRCSRHKSMSDMFRNAATIEHNRHVIEKPRAITKGYRCRACKKPILTSGLCYECTTGRARVIFSPAERELMAASA